MEYRITKTLEYLFIQEGSELLAHLPLGDSAILPGVDLLPPIEDEVEKLANEEFPNPYIVMEGLDISDAYRQGFVVGYNKAKEKYKYTEEDMKKAFEYGKTLEPFDSFEDLIQSLQQPKIPIKFKREMVEKIYCSRCVGYYDVTCGENDCVAEKVRIPKTMTNSLINAERTIEWVGEYIY
jgi:hypothetical protein